MHIKYLGSNICAFQDCTEGKIYSAQFQHIGDRDPHGWQVIENDQVAFFDDVGDLVCMHIDIVMKGFSIVEGE